jgi:cytoskeleton protein RodZ
MTIEGLGKKFQEARLARNLTLDEAARMTKIRPSRLAEIEADDFSQFPSLAYAKGFLLIYGKFLDVDVTPYMEAFETSEHVTVDGYSYLQDNPAPKPARAPIVRHRPSSSERTSLMPLVIGIIVLAVGFFLMKFILDIQRIAPRPSEQPQATQASPAPSAGFGTSVTAPLTRPGETPLANVASAPSVAPAPASAPSVAPVQSASIGPTASPVAVATPQSAPAATEPEVRRAEPVRPDELAKAGAVESEGPNRVAIRPLRKTYIKVVVDDEAVKPAFERWISPADGPVEFRGQHIAVRVLDRDAVQIKKNGKLVDEDDSDVTVE